MHGEASGRAMCIPRFFPYTLYPPDLSPSSSAYIHGCTRLQGAFRLWMQRTEGLRASLSAVLRLARRGCGGGQDEGGFAVFVRGV